MPYFRVSSTGSAAGGKLFMGKSFTLLYMTTPFAKLSRQMLLSNPCNILSSSSNNKSAVLMGYTAIPGGISVSRSS